MLLNGISGMDRKSVCSADFIFLKKYTLKVNEKSSKKLTFDVLCQMEFGRTLNDRLKYTISVEGR